MQNKLTVKSDQHNSHNVVIAQGTSAQIIRPGFTEDVFVDEGKEYVVSLGDRVAGSGVSEPAPVVPGMPYPGGAKSA